MSVMFLPSSRLQKNKKNIKVVVVAVAVCCCLVLSLWLAPVLAQLQGPCAPSANLQPRVTCGANRARAIVSATTMH